MSGEDKRDTSIQIQTLNMSDPNSPYYLSSADHPGNIISPITFNGSNYANMVHIVSNAQKSKNKYGFVDGTLTKPANNNPEVHA